MIKALVAYICHIYFAKMEIEILMYIYHELEHI